MNKPGFLVVDSCCIWCISTGKVWYTLIYAYLQRFTHPFTETRSSAMLENITWFFSVNTTVVLNSLVIFTNIQIEQTLIQKLQRTIYRQKCLFIITNQTLRKNSSVCDSSGIFYIAPKVCRGLTTKLICKVIYYSTRANLCHASDTTDTSFHQNTKKSVPQ